MWKKLQINNSLYFVKQEFTSESITTTFSDLLNIWEEVVLCREAILKFKHSNPNVTAKDECILEFIKSLTKETEFSLQMKENNGSIYLKMSSVLIPKMLYEFELLMKPVEVFYKEITLPLLLYINELKYQQSLLCKKLEEKDIEIMEYELDGCKITRKNVITPKFEKNEFAKEAMQYIEERLKSNMNNNNHDVIEELNVFYPFYQSVTRPLPADLLKEGKSIEDKKEESSCQVIEEVKTHGKRYTSVPNVLPIKRNKTSKRKIL